MAKKKYTKEKDIIKSLEDPDYDKANGYENEKKESDLEKEDRPLEKLNNDDTSDRLSPEDQKKLAMQVQAEFKYSKESNANWIEYVLKNLRLYNNQRKDKSKVGDPLMFTIHQTILAALYTDQLQVSFKGREDGDRNVAANLNSLAEYDFDIMDKDMNDYEYDWDATFFGRAFREFTHFDRETMTPIPEIIDPTSFIHDPRATSVAGNRLGRGSMRFGGMEVSFMLWELKNNPAYFNIEKIKLEKPSGGMGGDGTLGSLQEKARDARSEAKGTSNQPAREAELGANGQINLVKWYTYYEGQRCVVYLANDLGTVVRYHKLKSHYFPILDRTIYPTSHDWQATSIPDLLEDKQRFRSVIMNTMGDSLKADLYPMYTYNTQKIKNRANLDFAFNKHIPVDGETEGAIRPIQKAQVNSVLADYILQTLDADSQKATATPEIQQGAMSDTKRTLGEVEIIAGKASTRYSLSAKIFGWSEKRFWQHYYFMYKNYFEDDIDEKVIRIGGAWGDTYRKLTRENIISPIDPDVEVVSKDVSEAKKLRDQMRFEKFFSIVLQDPTANRRYGTRKLADLYSLKPDEVSRLLPENAAELQALEENIMLGKDQLPPIQANDNHMVHIEMHTMASETKSKAKHIKAHKEAIRLMQQNPDLFPDADPENFSQAGMTPPAINAMKRPPQGNEGNAAMAGAAQKEQTQLPSVGME